MAQFLFIKKFENKKPLLHMGCFKSKKLKTTGIKTRKCIIRQNVKRLNHKVLLYALRFSNKVSYVIVWLWSLHMGKGGCVWKWADFEL